MWKVMFRMPGVDEWWEHRFDDFDIACEFAALIVARTKLADLPHITRRSS
jgi:hypothetical protein